MGIVVYDYVQSSDSSSGGPEKFPDVDRHSCQLLGPTALIVQSLMGVFVILSLVYKRFREKPRRPWRIWLFDVSKQIVGQMFVHGVNVLVSIAAGDYSSNACVFYFLNILLDTTLGVSMIYVLLHSITYVLSDKFHLQGFESGNYGVPPRISYWLRQAAIYVCALTAMKFLVLGLLVLFPGLFKIGEWLLTWTYTQKGDKLQVIFTMGIFPIVMNVLQFWLIDSIVKASAAVVLPTENDGLDREPLFRSSSSDDEDGDDDGVAVRHDIENPAIRHPHSTRKFAADAVDEDDEDATPEEHKSFPSSSGTTPQGDHMHSHSYPPSLSTSIASVSSASTSPSTSFSRSLSPSESSNPRNPFKKRRPPPSALEIQVISQPAVNSPLFSCPPLEPGVPMVSSVPQPVQPKLEVRVQPPPEETNDWDDGWKSDDEDQDWADNVGKDEWTGKRLEERKGAIKAGWDTPTPLTGKMRVS